jgi:hypothetical protein
MIKLYEVLLCLREIAHPTRYDDVVETTAPSSLATLPLSPPPPTLSLFIYLSTSHDKIQIQKLMYQRMKYPASYLVMIKFRFRN